MSCQYAQAANQLLLSPYSTIVVSGPMPDADSRALKSSRDGDVAADAVGQLARPVPADGARDVALLVGGRVDVDLDEADVRVVEVRLRPVGVDERGRRWRIRCRHGWSLLHAVGGGAGVAREDGPAVASESVSRRTSRSRRLNSASRSVHVGALRARLADDPGVHPAGSSMVRVGPTARPRDDAGAVAVVGHPVRPELEDDVGHDRDGEQPVEVGRVEPIGDVGEPERPAALEPGKQVDDAERT